MKIKAKIDRMVNSGNVKAIASVSLDGMFVVKNLKIMDGKKGLFVSMPQETYSGKDGQKKYSKPAPFLKMKKAGILMASHHKNPGRFPNDKFLKTL